MEQTDRPMAEPRPLPPWIDRFALLAQDIRDLETMEDWPIASAEIKAAMDALVSAMGVGRSIATDLEPAEINTIVDAMGHLLCGDAMDSIRSIAIADKEAPETLITMSTPTVERDVLVRRLNILARRDLALRIFGSEARQRILDMLAATTAEDRNSD